MDMMMLKSFGNDIPKTEVNCYFFYIHRVIVRIKYFVLNFKLFVLYFELAGRPVAMPADVPLHSPRCKPYT